MPDSLLDVQTLEESWRVGIASYAMRASKGRLKWLPFDWLLSLSGILIKALLKGNARIIINAPPRHGKLCADNTLVPTPQGWRTHGELRPGDQVFGPDGKPTKVLAVSEPGRADVRVTFSNGEKIECNEAHEWVLFDRSSNHRTWRTMETRQLLGTNRLGKERTLLTKEKNKKNGRCVFQLPPVEALEYSEKTLSIEPYVLGAWLGDGSAGKPCITHDKKDTEIIEEIAKYYSVSTQCVHKKTGVVTTYFSGKRGPGNEGQLVIRLREIGVYKNKHIPDVFLQSSKEQRLQLLAGLIDTDGHVEHETGRVCFVTCSTRLCDDVYELVLSLGFRPYVTEQKPNTSTSGIVGKKITYTVGFQPACSIPTKIFRKRFIRIASQRQVGITKVERIENQSIGHCIQVDRPDGLYLVGEKLIPTHNSEFISHWLPTWYLDHWPEKQIILASYVGDFAATWGKKVRDEFLMNSFCQTKLRMDSRAVSSWLTVDGGGMKTAGVGGPITGRGANLVIIDDPHKNWEEAMSAQARERVVEWFNSTLYTRLEPSASIVVIQCMAGDTSVLMADGSEKHLRDIVRGDVVATYNAGLVEGARVNNWINNGLDLVFTIKMTSGISVKANVRHPFLVNHDGRPEWTRLKNLKPGDTILRVIGENGRESHAKQRAATNLHEAGGSVLPTIINGDGPQALDHRVAMLNPIEAIISNIDMESLSSNTKQCSKNKKECVPFAENRLLQKTLAPTGMENSALITSTELSRSEACCATIVTSPSDTARPNEFCSPLLDTYEIVLDTIAEITESGYEDVFDIEVDRTGNFIANGLVSHNTRWHEADLSGYLMSSHEDSWQMIRFPALAENAEGDVLGRTEGQALCPQRYSTERLNEIKKVLGSHIFAGLYQQRPAPLLGGIVKRPWFKYWRTLPGVIDEIIQTWDLTFKATGTSFAVGQVWCRSGANLFLLDQVRGKMDFLEQLRQITTMSTRWPAAITKIIEDAADAQAVKATLDSTVPGIILQRANGSKEARLSAVAGVIESGNVYLPEKADWLDEFLTEVTTFPGTVNDDQVDAMSLALDRLIQKTYDVGIRMPDFGVRANPWEANYV